jgi:hypothetical protein
MTTEYEFDWHEHYRASREASRYMRKRWLGWAFALLMLVLAFLNYRGASGEVSLTSVFLGTLPLIVGGVVWLAMLPYAQWRNAKKLSSRDASTLGPQKRSVDAEGYH